MSVLVMPTDSFKFIKAENVRRFRELRRSVFPADEIVIKPIRYRFFHMLYRVMWGWGKKCGYWMVVLGEG